MILGFCASFLFISSYQLKSRKGLIIVNASSRLLYIMQYILLGAFDGALLDIVAFAISLLCQNRDKGFIKKHVVLTIIITNTAIIGIGLIVYKNIFSIFAYLGVIFETSALWFKKERNIRLLSIAGAPCWLIYNLKNAAFGSVLGNIITIVSISIALFRHDFPNRSVGKSRKNTTS